MAQRGRPRHPELLTPREQEVLRHIRDGLTNEEIAERLGVSFNTAKTHVAAILSKFGVSTREEAARWREEERGGGWGLAKGIVALGGATAVAVSVAGMALLAFGVLTTDGGGTGASNANTHSATESTVTHTPDSSAVVTSPEQAIELADHDVVGQYGSGDAATTTAEYMVAEEAAHTLRFSGLNTLPIRPDGYECPGSCPWPGVPKDEWGYLVISRYSPPPLWRPTATPGPEAQRTVMVSWIGEDGGQLGMRPHVPTEAFNVPTEWRLIEPPRGLSLELKVAIGGSCESFHGINIDEDEDSVSIVALVRHDVTRPGEACLMYLVSEEHTVTLEAPLGDRALLGCQPEDAIARVSEGDVSDCREVLVR